MERFIVSKRFVVAEIALIEDDAVERVHVIQLRYGLPCVLRPREPFIETTLKITKGWVVFKMDLWVKF